MLHMKVMSQCSFDIACRKNVETVTEYDMCDLCSLLFLLFVGVGIL